MIQVVFPLWVEHMVPKGFAAVFQARMFWSLGLRFIYRLTAVKPLWDHQEDPSSQTVEATIIADTCSYSPSPGMTHYDTLIHKHPILAR